MEADMRELTAEPGGITDRTIYQQLEVVAAAFPWDRVSIWLGRLPEGIYDFTVYVEANNKTGSDSIFASSRNLEEAVNEALKQASAHDPEVARQKKIRELERELLRLKVRTFALPPYRAPNQLGFGERAIEPQPEPFINIESEGRPF